MNALCGADCSNCGYRKEQGCKGCEASGGCPSGEKCFIYQCIQEDGTDVYEQLKLTIMDEFNKLALPGMPNVTELYALNGTFVNLAYPMPNGEAVKLLNDNAVYLGNQICCNLDDQAAPKYFGLVAGMDFLLVSLCADEGREGELLTYRRR